ncbi:MAG: zinc-ribbon domain-containing protein [Clostridiaceae bacterium]|jgi:uncharacterized membrane protein|nr:zinc-ribbon domain-containing protein [Clostridiaceae bacterium]HOA30561.1 zinc-ribbon domain-containing protein [Clostridia bacterium]
MYCSNCGAENNDEAKFCNKCGSTVAGNTPAVKEVEDNKVIFILAYLGILFFLPLVACPNSKVGRFHANQGLLLFILSVAGQIVLGILSLIAGAIYWLFGAFISFISWIWWILILVLAIMCMISANKGEQKPLPVIGKIKIIK